MFLSPLAEPPWFYSQRGEGEGSEDEVKPPIQSTKTEKNTKKNKVQCSFNWLVSRKPHGGSVGVCVCVFVCVSALLCGNFITVYLRAKRDTHAKQKSTS